MPRDYPLNTSAMSNMISKMTKKLLTLGILAIVLGGIFAPARITAQSCTGNQIVVNGRCVDPFAGPTTNPCTSTQVFQGGRCVERSELNGPTPTSAADLRSNVGSSISDVFSDIAFDVFSPLIKGLSATVMGLASAILWLAGKFFDTIVKFSVIDMAKTIGGGEGTVGESINQAWRALRDIANMFFIFVLLFVAFKAMFSLSFGDVSKNILNIVIVALLINFSLFFSKIVIDASNIVAVGFYNSITTTPVSSVLGEGSTVGNSGGQSTITTGYMRLLGLNGLYDPKVLLAKPGDSGQMLITGIMSSIFLLITAVIFLITGFMFVTRFIILVFLMILSPLALIAIIIPGQQGQFKKWLGMLVDQSFFAPLFFALTWVAFKIGVGLKLSESLLGANKESLAAALKNSPEGAALILNYVLVIGFSVAALILSKQMATKTAGFTAITGGMTAGVAFAGRQTIGRGAKWIGENRRESWSKSSLGRAGLWAANKGASGSFDIKGIGESKAVKAVGGGELFKGLGSATGKGGFNKAVEEKAEAKAKYAKQVYGQTVEETEEAKRREVIYNTTKTSDEQRIKEARQKAVESAKETSADNENRRRQYLEDKIKPNQEAVEKAKQEQTEKERKLEEEKKRSGDKSPQAFALEKEVEAAKAKVEQETNNLKEAEKRIENTDETYKELKETAQGSKEEYDEALKNLKKPIDEREYSQEVKNARDAWMDKKEAGKRRMHEFADRVERGSPVSKTIGVLAAGGALGAVFGVPGAIIGAGIGAAGGSWVGDKLGENFKWTNWRGNTEAGRKIRDAAEGKDKKKSKKAVDEFLKNMDISVEDDEESGGKGDKKEKEGGGEEKGKKDES